MILNRVNISIIMSFFCFINFNKASACITVNMDTTMIHIINDGTCVTPEDGDRTLLESITPYIQSNMIDIVANTGQIHANAGQIIANAEQILENIDDIDLALNNTVFNKNLAVSNANNISCAFCGKLRHFSKELDEHASN